MHLGAQSKHTKQDLETYKFSIISIKIPTAVFFGGVAQINMLILKFT